MSQTPSMLLRKAKTDDQLAEEVVSGGLNPYTRDSHRSTEPLMGDDDESDEVFAQIKFLLKSAMTSGQLRSLARAVVLAWQAGYDSKLLREVEPKLVKKANETVLMTEMKRAIEARQRAPLTDCINRATELGVNKTSSAIFAKALEVDHELELEAREAQAKARPATTEKYSHVLGELSSQMFGLDIKEVVEEVERSSALAKTSCEANSVLLHEGLSEMDDIRHDPASNEKLLRLKDLLKLFHKVNPQHLENTVNILTSKIEDLRADNAELMLALRSNGVHIVTLSASSDGNIDAVPEEVMILRQRVEELEANETVLKESKNEAAKLGAKWMENKKDAEIKTLLAEKDAEIQRIQNSIAEEVQKQIKRRSEEVSRAERKAKADALQGQEDTMKRKHDLDKVQIKQHYELQIERLQNVVDALESRNSKKKGR